MQKNIACDEGFSQSKLDSFCVVGESPFVEESPQNSPPRLNEEGLSQAVLSALSVQDCDESSGDEEGEGQLRRLRRLRAFREHEAEKEFVKATTVTVPLPSADYIGGISQTLLDAMCVSEIGNSSGVESLDSKLYNARRIRAFAGSAPATAFSVAEQNQFDLIPVSESTGISQKSLDNFCNKEFDGGEHIEIDSTDDDTEHSTRSADALLLRSRRMRAFLGHEEANQFAASLRCTTSDAEDEVSSATSRESNVDGSPEPVGSMLLRIRRTRAFAGHERALTLSAEIMADTDSQSALVVSPSMSTLTVGQAVSSTTCSTKSSLCEEHHSTSKAEVDTTASLEMRLTSPKRKLRVVRGGA